MKGFTVYWKINDGRRGFPNIEAEPGSGEYFDNDYLAAGSYEAAIKRHFDRAQDAGGNKWRWTGRIKDIQETERGSTNGARHRMFCVTYTAPDKGDDITCEVKVICRSYNKKAVVA